RPLRLIVLGVEAIASANPEPVGVENAVGAACRARSAPAPVVLQAAADEVRLPHVSADGVELPDGYGVDVLPRLTTVVGDVDAPVVADDQMIAVFRIDPDRVMIAVRHPLDGAPRLAAVGRFEEWRATLIGDLRVRRIDPHLAVIHPAVTLVRQNVPGLAAVVRAPDATLRWIRRRGILTTAASETAATAASAPLSRRHQRPIVVDAGAGPAA